METAESSEPSGAEFGIRNSLEFAELQVDYQPKQRAFSDAAADSLNRMAAVLIVQTQTG